MTTADEASSSSNDPNTTAWKPDLQTNWEITPNEYPEWIRKTLGDADSSIRQRQTHQASITKWRLALTACANMAEDLSNRHGSLIRHSAELTQSADRLAEQERVLSLHAQEIGQPLLHYDAVDQIGVQVGVLFKSNAIVRGLPTLQVDSDDFQVVLGKIDRALAYFGEQSGGKEALQEQLQKKNAQTTSGNLEYYKRALALQEAALDLIKEAVVDRIQTTTNQVAGALQLKSGKTLPADQLEASLVYTRFHGISSRSNTLLNLLRSRQQHPNHEVSEGYLKLFQHCRQTYCSCRELLLQSTVRAHMESLQKQHGAVGMTRLASVFLIRLCTIETALFGDFFAEKILDGEAKDDDVNNRPKISRSSSKSTGGGFLKDSEFQSYLISLCSSLHRTIRRTLVTMHDLDTLCQIVSVLREERSMARASPTTMAAARAISTVIEDAQERLIFCANSTLTKEVMKFKPTPGDLDYPDKLRKEKEAIDPNDDDAMEKQLQQVYDSWFPPLRTVLKVLSKIFRVVEPKVFEDMALTSVQSCTRCLKDGANYIKSNKGEMHSDLFLVKHLLILREQLSPFDIELRSVERQLDFSDAGKAVARFLANRNRRVFSMSTENALVTLLREGVSVQEASVDSKRDLEDALRSACNAFIDHTSQSIAKDLLALVESCRVAEAGANPLGSRESVMALLEKLRDTVEVSLGEVTSQMALYLDNPATQSILIKPVSRKVTRALEELRKFSQAAEGWSDDDKAAVVKMVEGIEETVRAASKSSK